jgi:DnaK suppressor protein
VKKLTTQKFKRIFEMQLEAIAYNTRIVRENLSVSPDDRYDEIDHAASDLEQSMLMRLKNREALYVRKIKDALKRIEAGTFGECQECGEDIELRRLEARPTATMCLSCKEDQERKELHINSEIVAPKFLAKYPINY